ncbi:MAG: NAD-dependent epimerase/dehydratase family protein [Methanothrix sp.]|nr:NAD-dependent epimerase/dehydratase family protein [Methanothrix sp.]
MGSLDLLDKNILITGISGFVGSRMAKRLVEEGANVFDLLRRRGGGKVPHNMLRLGLEKEVRLAEDDL